jgi:hypothetical protein
MVTGMAISSAFGTTNQKQIFGRTIIWRNFTSSAVNLAADLGMEF